MKNSEATKRSKAFFPLWEKFSQKRLLPILIWFGLQVFLKEARNVYHGYHYWEFQSVLPRLREMKRDEQHRLVQSLRDFADRMGRDERSNFEMMLKRDRDDEDLDSLSLRRLHQLHEKYVGKKSKRDLEELWKKLTKDQGKSPDSASEA